MLHSTWGHDSLRHCNRLRLSDALDLAHVGTEITQEVRHNFIDRSYCHRVWRWLGEPAHWHSRKRKRLPALLKLTIAQKANIIEFVDARIAYSNLADC